VYISRGTVVLEQAVISERAWSSRSNSFTSIDEDPDTAFASFDGGCRHGVTTILVEEGDMNPLKPCGACSEWLKKIAEVNPVCGADQRLTDYKSLVCCHREIHIHIVMLSNK
jgi:hypothetical protein